jgi:hypothetical protein
MSVQTVHDPDRFIADLRQILSQGRKRIGLIVGAGAPMSIKVDANGKLSETGASLIPGVNQLTNLVCTELQDETHRVAVTTLAQALGENTNIEQILSQVRLLEKALGKVKVQGLDSQGYKLLGESICNQIGKIVAVSLPTERNAYNELITWISGTLRSHAVEIFTTNYDLLFEEAFERARVPFFDGFNRRHGIVDYCEVGRIACFWAGYHRRTHISSRAGRKLHPRSSRVSGLIRSCVRSWCFRSA